jgi:tetratricopeptide (TPR) repeat protein
MSERKDPSVSMAPPAPVVQPPEAPVEAQTPNVVPPAPPTPEEEGARDRIAALEREARALGSDPSAAMLFHEIGLLWEEPLRNLRNAAVAFQNAFRLAPTFLANIRAARRLFSDVGNWQMVVQLIDAELEASNDPAGRAALLYEKAVVLEERLSKEFDAVSAYGESLAERPTDVTLLVQLETVFARRADARALVEVYRLLAAAVKDDALRAHYLTSAGTLLEDRLQQPAEAAETYRQAFTLDRKDPLLVSAVRKFAEKEGCWDELLEALAAEAELQGSEAGPSYLRMSKVYQKLGRQEDALASLLAAQRANSNEPLVLAELAGIYEQAGRYEELAAALLAWSESVTDEGERIALNLRLAALYEEKLRRDEDAIIRYRAVLGRSPHHSAALAGLGKLCFRLKRWDELVAVFDAEVAGADDPKLKVVRMYKAAEVLEERLERVAEAVQRYQQCLQIAPGYLPAQKALARLYERQNRYADLAAMYEQDLQQTSDREHIVSTLAKIASIYEERLNDLDQAIHCMRRILDLTPDHLPTLRNLARLHERAGQWLEVIRMHEAEASRVGDTKQVLSLHHRNAEILEEQLKDRGGAIQAYERLLALSPSYLPALRALGRLYAQDERWQDLIEMYRAEAEISSSTEQAASLIQKVGELYEQKLKNENEAIASYQEVLTLAPSHFPALRALAQIYRTQGSWESLIEVLRSEAANRIDPVERANALYQAASIWEDALDNRALAIEGYQEVLRLNPSHAAALGALERLHEAADHLSELVAVLHRVTQNAQVPSARAAAQLKLAHLYFDRLNEPSRAAQACEAVLATDPTNLFALKLLDRLRASDRARRAEVRTLLADQLADARMKTALRLSAAADQGESTAELAQLKQAFEQSPQDERLAFTLERSLRAAGDFAGLAELYQKRLEATPSGEDRLELLLRMGDLAERKLGEPRRAIGAYEAALAMRPNLVPALQGLSRVHRELGDFAAAHRALLSESDAAHDVVTAVAACNLAAQLARDSMQNADLAVEAFRKALTRDPLDPTAIAGIEDLLAARGGAVDLADLQERRAEAKLAQGDALAAAEELYNAARTWLTQVKDVERANAAVERALVTAPTHAGALELKAELSLQSAQYSDAAAALAYRIQQGGEAAVLAPLHLKLGAIYQDHLSELTRAAAHLQTALAQDPANVDALDRLASIYTVSRNWTGAADCLKRLLELTLTPEDEARHTLSLARLMDSAFADAGAAIPLYRRVLELTPSTVGVVDRLWELSEKTGSTDELISLFEQLSKVADDPERRTSMRLTLAELYAGPAQSPSKAIAELRGILEEEPKHVKALSHLAGLLGQDDSTLPSAIDAHRQLLALEPGRVDSLHALFAHWQKLKQTDKAFSAAAVLDFLGEAREEESAYFFEARARLPAETHERLAEQELETVLHHDARGPLNEVLRAIGDQLSKLFPPHLEALSIDKRADRLKPDHVIAKAVRGAAQVFGVEELEVYQAPGAHVGLENTDPLCVYVGQDVVRRFNSREQRFLLGRAAMGLVNKTPVLQRFEEGKAGELLGAAVRISVPNFTGLGPKSDELSKQVRKACSRKALKTLEAAADQVVRQGTVGVDRFLTGLELSADRAGLLMAADVSSGLVMLLRDDPLATNNRSSAEAAREAMKQRPEVQQLVLFAVSEDFFRLRRKLKLAV